MKVKPILLVLIALLISVNISAQEVDQRIERQLNDMQMQFTTTTSGNFKLLFDMENGRSQIVFINSKTKMHEDAEVREISSPAAFISTADQLSHEKLWKLLAANFESVLGAWQLEPATDGWGLHFTVKVPAMMPEKRLIMYMVHVAKVADAMEKEFSAVDTF